MPEPNEFVVESTATPEATPPAPVASEISAESAPENATAPGTDPETAPPASETPSPESAGETTPADGAADPGEVSPAPDEQISSAPAPDAGEAATPPEEMAETAPDIPAPEAALPGEGVDPAGMEITSSVEAAANLAEKAAEIQQVSPHWIFLLGLGLLSLFVWYFAAEDKKRKRLVGTILSIVVAGLAAFFFQTYSVEQGIELKGGVSMEILIKEVPGRTITPETQQQVIKILNKRLNALGAREVILAPSGKDGVFLQVPGAKPEQVEEMTEVLEKVAKLEFSIVHPESRFAARLVAEGDQVIPGFEALPYRLSDQEKEENLEAGLAEDTPNRWELVKIKRDMSGKNVQSAGYYYGQEGHAISVSFTSAGAGIMGPLTLENKGQQLAIILDNEIVSAPVINEPFSSGCSITGDFTEVEAKELVAALENPLENPIEIAYSNYISPTMGKLTVQQGIFAGVAGLVLTLIFIIFYYRFAGVLALIGLCLNIAIIFGVLALFRFTLTLPGIAGIILTIGVAIDANVLIYERLREELQEGKSLKAAIDTAYDKAFSAIIDANITTLITALILFFLATGTVKGFAITLIIGIAASLFSALLVTRICFSWATDSFLRKLAFMNIIPDRVIDFLGYQKPAAIASITLLVFSLIIVPIMDPRGVELKGGDAVTIQSGAGLTKQDVIDSLSDVNFGAKPIVQVQSPVGGQGEFFLVRVPDDKASLVQNEVVKDLDVDINNTEVRSVGSTIGKSMLFASVRALLVGLVIILLYVTFRFEFAFALGAVAALFHDLILTAGITTLLGQEMSLITVGALLTIAGYSINDTIVVFDRVREGLATKRGNVRDIMNYCLNRTLARTILTSATTLLIVVVLFLFGGPGMRNFALTLIVGVVVGTYSSIFVASPIVLWWAKRSGTNLRRAVLETEQGKIDPLANQGTA